jgi:hypothetical protein
LNTRCDITPAIVLRARGELCVKRLREGAMYGAVMAAVRTHPESTVPPVQDAATAPVVVVS